MKNRAIFISESFLVLVLDGGFDARVDSINQIVWWFEDNWKMPFIKNESLPHGNHWPNMLRAASFVLLDWQFWNEGAETQKQVVIENIKEFLSSASENLVPVFILANANPDDVKAELNSSIGKSDSQQPRDASLLAIERNSSFWDGENVDIEKLANWVFGNASIYTLKAWDRSFEDARNELFKTMRDRSVDWPRVFWKSFREDGADPSASITTLIKEAQGPGEARVPAKPRPSGGQGLLEMARAPLRGSAPPAEKPDRGGPGLRPGPEDPAGGVSFRPRCPDRCQPSGARPAGPAARREELALLLDGGRGGSRRNRPEPGRRAPAPGCRPSSRVEEPAPKRWKNLFADDPAASDLGTGVPAPRFRSARRRLNPVKSDKIPTS